MKNWFQFLVSISLIVFSISTFAGEVDGKAYGRIVGFGDSLSDMGTYGMVASPFGGGKFTTNPGKIWIEVVGEKLKLEVKAKRQEGFGLPVRELGGFVYAQGGSRVLQPKVQAPEEAPSATSRPLAEQVQIFLGEHKNFKADDLVLIQGGANDLFAQLTSVQAGKITPEQAVQNMLKTADDLAAIMANLKNNGAQKIVFVNLPAVEQTPRVILLKPEVQQFVKTMVVTFNAAVAQKAVDLNVQVVDFYGFDLDFNANFEKLGFKNISLPGCKNTKPTSSSLFCSAKSLFEPGSDLTYKFADEIHPATGFSKVAGEFIYNEIVK